jgi:hypothetical protein
MAQPEEFEWATNDITELKDINNDGNPVALLNKKIPNIEVQESGMKYKENWPRQYLNYAFNVAFRWIKHLDARYIVGDTHTTTTAEDATAISTRLGGTWVLVGVQSLAGENNNVFKKTA